MPAETPARCVAWFYKDEAGRVLGPSVIETLSTLWRVGELTASTLVKPESAARFVRICDAPALQQLLQSHAAAPAPSPALSALLNCAEALDFEPLQTPAAAPAGSDWCVVARTAVRVQPARGVTRARWRVRPRRGALAAERAALARARERLREDVEAFERYRADALALLSAKQALLAQRPS
jgi:hypothetical protein